MTPRRNPRGNDTRAVATGLKPKKPGNLRTLRRCTGGGTAASRAMDASNPTYIFTKRRVGYWMPKGKTVEEETACPRRGMRQNVLKTEELSETSSRLGKPICAGRYRRIKVKQGRALQSDWRRGRTRRLKGRRGPHRPAGRHDGELGGERGYTTSFFEGNGRTIERRHGSSDSGIPGQRAGRSRGRT